jgi:uncharacterized protein
VRKKHLLVWFVLSLFALSACGPAQLPLPSGESGALAASETPPSNPLSVEILSPSPIATITSTITLTPTVALSPTPDPYAGLAIADLIRRSYGGGELLIVQTLEEYNSFTRYLIAYPSDGLTIYGFMNLPRGDGSFPVIIASHGYINPEVYDTLDYTTHYADELAKAGFLVLHPNLRGYRPSDDGPNLFRVGMAVDVLNLIGHVKNQAGLPGPLERANPEEIGLWGHSMGGGISTRAMVVSPDVDAVVLYGAMSGDDLKNYERIFNVFSQGSRGLEELSAPPEAFQRISPVYFLDQVQAAVSIHHGENDQDVPLEWSVDLCDRLQRLGKSVECFIYPGQPHTFFGENDQLFIQRSIEFFARLLRD